MQTEQSIKTYLAEIASNSPTPGGGNVSAFCGAIASCLGTMVCNLTIGKKKYAQVEAEINDLLSQIQGLIPVFLSLAGQDNDAFERVMTAFKLPKETEEEKNTRTSAIDAATFGAALVPKSVIEHCAALLPLLIRLSEIGNQNSLSDAAVAISLTATAAEGAFLNVLINCSALAGNSEAKTLSEEAEQRCISIRQSASGHVGGIIQKLKGNA